MTPDLLPPSAYDLDLFEGWDNAPTNDGFPVVRVTADMVKQPGGIARAFSDSLSSATAFTIQEIAKVALGVAIHFTPPNGKSVTPLRTTTGAKGVNALKKRIARESSPSVLNGSNFSAGKITAIPGGDPENPVPVQYRIGNLPVPEGIVPRSVGGWLFVQPRSVDSQKITYTDPLALMRKGGYFTKARKSDNVRRYARPSYRKKFFWVRPGALDAAVKHFQKNAGMLVSGWNPAAQLLGYGARNRSDFHPGADGVAKYYGSTPADLGFMMVNRELKNLQVARIKNKLDERIIYWANRSLPPVLQNLEKKYVKTLQRALDHA